MLKSLSLPFDCSSLIFVEGVLTTSWSTNCAKCTNVNVCLVLLGDLSCCVVLRTVFEINLALFSLLPFLPCVLGRSSEMPSEIVNLGIVNSIKH